MRSSQSASENWTRSQAKRTLILLLCAGLGRVFVSAITPFLNGQSFAPDLTKIMSDAYDLARKELHDRGQPVIVLEIIASRIIALAKAGERDPAQICKQALSSLGLGR